jgi:hypothetical protein
VVREKDFTHLLITPQPCVATMCPVFDARGHGRSYSTMDVGQSPQLEEAHISSDAKAVVALGECALFHFEP